MITIIKDGNKMKCSQNTYDTMYKRLGYEILQETPKVEIKKEEPKEIKAEEPKEIKTEEITKKTKERKNTKSKNKKGE